MPTWSKWIFRGVVTSRIETWFFWVPSIDDNGISKDTVAEVVKKGLSVNTQ
jgi:hypothetical protein